MADAANRLSSEATRRQDSYISPRAYRNYVTDESAKLDSLLEQGNYYKQYLMNNKDAYAGKDYGQALLDINKRRSYLSGAQEDLGSEGEYRSLYSKDDWETSKRLSKYDQIEQQPDYEANSRYQSTANGEGVKVSPSGQYKETGYGDLIYEAVNGNEDARNMLLARRDAQYGGYGLILGKDDLEINSMTPQEVSRYNYLYSTEGPEAAEQYRRDLTSKLNYRERNTVQQRLTDRAQNGKWLGDSLATVLASPLKAATYAGQGMDYLLNGSIDQNAGYNRWSYGSGATRDAVSKKAEEKWGKAGSFAYQTAMSMGDFLFNAAVTGGNKALSLAIMGASAAADTVLSLKDQGLSDGRAFTLGTIAGAIEIITEMIGWDALFKADKLGQSFLKYTINNTLSEASEEGTSDVLNWLVDGVADAITGTQESEWKREIQRLQTEEGMDYDQAKRKVIAERLTELGLDVAGGALSGLIMGGFGGAGDYVSHTRMGRQFTGRTSPEGKFLTPRTGSAEFQGSEALGRRNTLMDAARSSIEGTTAYDVLQQLETKQARGHELTAEDMGRLYYANELARQQSGGAENLLRQAAEEMTQNGRLDGETRQKIMENPYALQELGVDADLSERQQRQAVRQAVQERAVQQEIERTEEFEANPAEKLNARSQAEYKASQPASRLQAEAEFMRQQTRQRAQETAEQRVTQAAKDTFGTEGARVAQEMFKESDIPEPQYYAAFSAFYQAGVRGSDPLDVRRDYSLTLTNEQRMAAYKAGTQDAANSLEAQKDAVKAQKAVGGGLVEDDYTRSNLKAETASRINKLGKKFGVTVAFADSVRGGTANAAYSGADIVIEKNNPNPEMFLMGHELTHRMQSLAPKEYRKFREELYKLRPQLAQTAEVKGELYSNKGVAIDYDKAMDEAAADFVGRLLNDDKALGRFIDDNLGNRTMLEKIRDFFRDVAAALTGDEKARAERAMRRIEKALTETSKAAQKQAKELQSTENSTKANKNAAADGGGQISMKSDVLALEGVDWMDNFSSIKEQLAKHADEINKMEPVAVVEFSRMTAEQAKSEINDQLSKIGGKRVSRNGIVFDFDKTGINSIVSHASNSEEYAAALASPYVAKFGKLITGHKNHKGKGNATLTYAAPAVINGDTVNVGVAIMFSLDGRPHAVNVGLQSNGAFRVNMAKAPEGNRSRVYRYGKGTALPTSSASGGSIAFDAGESKQNFSLKSPVEETKNLIALHNLNSTKLAKALDLGGFPMPSIAVTKTDIPHTNFGDITLVMDKSTIDPQADRRNTVYSADAWTPTFPQIEYEADSKAASRLSDKYYDLYKRFGSQDARPLYVWGNGADMAADELQKKGGEAAAIRELESDTDMMKLFLLDTGREVPAPVTVENVTKMDENSAALYRHLAAALGTDAVNDINLRDGEKPTEARRRWMAEHGDDLKDAYTEYVKGLGLTAQEAENAIEHETTLSLTTRVLETRNFLKNGTEKRTTVTDTAATKEAIRKATDQKAYKEWLHGLFDGIEKGTGVYNGKGYYTPSGNRRSFSATHYEATLDNIAKAMAAQNNGNSRNVSGFYGVKSLRAGMAKRFSSIKQMHEYEGRLQHLTQAEADSINDALGKRLSDLLERIYSKSTHKSSNDNYFIAMDSIGDILMEATEQKSVSVDSVAKVFSRYGYDLGNALASDVRDLLFDISQMPVNIFEAKPERAVRFNEVLAAVVPTGTDRALKDKLKAAGVANVLEYEKDNDSDRMAKVNSVEGARFSIKGGEVYNRTAVLEESTVDKYLKDYASKSSPKYAQAYIAYMSPAEFIALTTSREGRAIIAQQTGELDIEKLKDATVYQPFQLRIDHETGEVIGHEGRHRLTALMKAGVERVPVLLFDSSNKNSKTAMDSLTLTGQDFGHSRSYARVTVNNVQPLSYGNRQAVVDMVSSQPTNERIAENYGRQTVRYSIKHPTFTDEEIEKNKNSLKNMKPVIMLTGKEFAKGTIDLMTQVLQFFDSLGNNVYSDRFGDVSLSKSSWRSERRHGMTADKAITFAAVPDVIKNGTVIDVYYPEGKIGVERIVVAAPVTIGTKPAYVGVMLQRDFQSQRLYLHDVVRENDQGMLPQTQTRPDASGVQVSRGQARLDISTILLRALEVKTDYSLKPGTTPVQAELSDAETKYSLKGTENAETVAALRRENTRLKKQVENLKAEFKKTKPEDRLTVRAGDTARVAKRLFKDYGTRLFPAERAEFTEQLQSLYNYMTTEPELTWEDAHERAMGLAKILIDRAVGVSEAFDKDVFNYLKDAKFVLDKRDQADVSPDFREWKKGTKLKVTVADSGGNVDSIYEDLSSMRPGLFPEDITHPGDRLRQIAEVYENLNAARQVNPWDMPVPDALADARALAAADVLDSFWDSRQTAKTFADKAEERVEAAKAKGREKVEVQKAKGKEALKKLREQKNAKIKETKAEARQQIESLAKQLSAEHAAEMAELRQLTRQKIDQVRQQKNDQIEQMKHHSREMRRREQERRSESEARKKLLRIAQRLEKMKTTAVNRELINSVIGELDTVSVSITEKSVQKLSDLREWYDDQRLNNPDFISDPTTEKKLSRLSKKQISELTLEEVRELTDVLKNIEAEIRNANKLINTEDRRDTYHMGVQIIADVQASGGTRGGALDKFILTQTLSPVREMRRVTGYNDADPLYKATLALADGQRQALTYQMTAQKPFQEFARDKRFNKMFSGKDAKGITISGTTADGVVQVTISPAMRASLYLHSLSDQNLKHIAEGGISVPDWKYYQKGDMEKAWDNDTVIKLSPSEVRAIVSEMTDREKDFARKAWQYFNTVSKQAINSVSEKLVGYSLAGVENYFPINTDPDFLRKEFEAIKYDGSLEGMGWTKERVNAANPILLRDANEVLEQGIRMHSQYVGLAIPVRNFNKLWGVTKSSFVTDETGNVVTDDKGNLKRNSYESSVQKAVKKKWGSAAVKYVEKMMSDVQGATRGPSNEFSKALAKIRSAYAGAVLNLNLGVAVKQAASYPTAAAVLGWSPLVKAMGNVGKVDLDLIAEYTPLQWYRSLGYSTKELGDMAKSDSGLQKALSGPVLNWIQGADLLTTRKLWKASEFYVRAHDKNLKQGTPKYYEQVADIYNRVIEETQPNYTTMQRPQLLRTESDLLANLAMFKTQPFQNFNILYDAAGNLHAKLKQGDPAAIKEARRGMVNAVTSQMAQLAIFAGMTAAWALARGKGDKYKDDDGELAAETLLKGLAKDVASGTLSMVPMGSEAWDMVNALAFGERYYGLDATAISALSDLTTAATSAVSAITDVTEQMRSGGGVNWNAVRIKMDKIAGLASKALGVPYDNATGLLEASAYRVLQATEGIYVGKYYSLLITTDPQSSKAQYYKVLEQAYDHDQEAYDKIYADMVERDLLASDSKSTEELIAARMKSRLKGDYAEQLNEAYEAGDTQAQQEIIAEATQTGYLSEKDLQAALEKSWQEAQGVSKVSELDGRYVPPEKQESYSADRERVQSSPLWEAASETARAHVEDAIYGYASGQKKYSKWGDKIADGAKYGLDEGEWMLFRLALYMADEATGGNSSYDNGEVEEAIRKVPGLTSSERRYLWEAQGKSAKTNPF